MKATRLVLAALACIPMLGSMGSAVAQAKDAYPVRPVRIIVPFLAGGAVDLVARILGQGLSARLGQNFVVDNRGGAGGTIGADAVAKAAPDGHTLLFTAQGPLVINPFLMKQLPYDPQTAFAPISVVVEAPNVLTVHPPAPFGTVSEFVAYGKANPQSMTFGSQGVGTTGHITGGMITQQTGVQLTHIPYKGFPPMLTDVLGGRVLMMLTDTVNVVPRIKAKELVAVAVAGEKRSTVLPDVPTFAESGYPGIVAGPWFSLLAPAGTPMELRDRLAAEVRRILATPEVASQLTTLGVEVRGTTPQQFETFLKSEYERWGDAIRASGITPE